MAEPTVDEAGYIAILGRAVVKTWGDLSPDVQHKIFEAATQFGAGELLPDEIGRFLHDHHPKTGSHEK